LELVKNRKHYSLTKVLYCHFHHRDCLYQS
jgi:hypothetical protein